MKIFRENDFTEFFAKNRYFFSGESQEVSTSENEKEQNFVDLVSSSGEEDNEEGQCCKNSRLFYVKKTLKFVKIKNNRVWKKRDIHVN